MIGTVWQILPYGVVSGQTRRSIMPEKTIQGHSINQYLRVLTASLVIVCVVNILLIIATIQTTRNERLERLESTIGIYLGDVATKFKAIDHFMDYSVVNESSLKEMAPIDPNANSVALIKPLNQFRQRVFDFQYNTGKAYQFFYYSPQTGYFTNVSSLQMGYDPYLKLKSALITGWATQTKIAEEPWRQVKIDGTYYLYHEVKYEGVVLFCTVKASALTHPIQTQYLANADLAYIRLNGHDLVNRQDPRYRRRNLSPNHFIHQNDDSQTLPFTFNVVVNRFGRTEQFTLIQLMLMTLTMIIGIAAMFGAFYLWRNFVVPLRTFSSTVTLLQQSPNTASIQNSRIKELENVNHQFHTLMQQVRSLKVSLYEKEIQQKKTQIQFMQLQVRPHFYLNILTTLYSMLQMNQTAHMGELILSATRYMRYLLNAGAELVPLSQEISHVNDYLNIQRIRYGNDVIQVVLDIAPQTKCYLVPPLMLQTFVENSVKYAVSFDRQTKIEITAKTIRNQYGDVLAIHIQDNGPGFPKDILDALTKSHLIALNEHHIGINNVINRLDLLFNQSYQLTIGNRPEGGAYIDLTLPVQQAVKKGELTDESTLS